MLVERADDAPLLLARCGCGAVLDVAEARLHDARNAPVGEAACTRCGDPGRIVDHAALQWVQNVP